MSMDDWERGYAAGYAAGRAAMDMYGHSAPLARDLQHYERTIGPMETLADAARFEKMYARRGSKPKRKLSKWQKFVKANSKKKQFIYQSGAKKGKLNLKKMGIAYRRQNK